MLANVISGGQTGADQAGLRTARRFGIPTSGWMPKGWETSRGPDPELGREFGLQEHPGGYAERTEANVRDSDGTLRFAADFSSRGERCTFNCIQRHGKPYFDVHMNDPPPVETVAEWIERTHIRVLNIAGNVEPKSRTARAYGITDFVASYLADLFRILGHPERTLQ